MLYIIYNKNSSNSFCFIHILKNDTKVKFLMNVVVTYYVHLLILDVFVHLDYFHQGNTCESNTSFNKINLFQKLIVAYLTTN